MADESAWIELLLLWNRLAGLTWGLHWAGTVCLFWDTHLLAKSLLSSCADMRCQV